MSELGHTTLLIIRRNLYKSEYDIFSKFRVIRPLPTERNYHIFYQLMAGLTTAERRQLGLAGYSIQDLRYLNQVITSSEDDFKTKLFRVLMQHLFKFWDTIKDSF